MSWQATVRSPVRVTFAHLADPSRLGDWLPEVTGPVAPPAATGEVFALTVGTGQRAVAAGGELTAFEPPWLAGYRLFIGSWVVTLRVTCTACAVGTQVRLHQSGDITLAVDLDRLANVLDQGQMT
jgi:hypothetical protein